MVLTESCNYNANHIGAIRTFKEDINVTYNVKIDITRNMIGSPSGTLQVVNITGALSDISKVKNKLTSIVYQADQDYQQYKKRKNARPQSPKKSINLNNLRPPEITIKKKQSSNPFYLLDESDGESDGESENLSNEYNPNLSWGDQEE